MAVKNFRDIKTSTGARTTRTKRILSPGINLSLGRFGVSSLTKQRLEPSNDWSGSIEKYAYRPKANRRSKPMVNWGEALKHRISLLKEEIAECKKFECEGIAGAEKLVKQLKDRLANLQNILDQYHL